MFDSINIFLFLKIDFKSTSPFEFVYYYDSLVFIKKNTCSPNKSSWLQGLIESLNKLTLPRGDWSLSLATAQAATDRPLEDGQTEDGVLRWRIGEDEEHNLIIRLGSHRTELEGTTLRLWMGDWQQDIVLSKVAPDQVGAEVTIYSAHRAQLETDTILRLELAEVF